MSDSPAAILYDPAGNAIGIAQDGAVYRLKVDARETPAVTAVRTQVNDTASDTLLLAANLSRLGVIIYNHSSSPLFVGFGNSAVTLTNFSFIIIAHSERILSKEFVGEIRGLWQTDSSGSAQITELT